MHRVSEKLQEVFNKELVRKYKEQPELKNTINKLKIH